MNKIETKPWKTKRLAPYMYWTAVLEANFLHCLLLHMLKQSFGGSDYSTFVLFPACASSEGSWNNDFIINEKRRKPFLSYTVLLS